jgi:hypothetical protein
MDEHFEFYWQRRLEATKDALEENGFRAYVRPGVDQARELVLKTILPETRAESVSWAGSGTFHQTGLYDVLINSELKVVDTFADKVDFATKLELRRQALLVDAFFLSANALTEDGVLINLDMIGNRVAGLTFGPKHVVVLVGRNKLVPDIQAGIDRVKNYAAPINARRLGKKTPCAETGFCQDCSSPDRTCNTWTITEKSFPKGRIQVVLINQDLGI